MPSTSDISSKRTLHKTTGNTVHPLSIYQHIRKTHINCGRNNGLFVCVVPPEDRRGLDVPHQVHGRWRRGIVRARIHSVPSIEQLVHLGVGQRCQRERTIQVLHVHRSPVRRQLLIDLFLSRHTYTITVRGMHLYSILAILERIKTKTVQVSYFLHVCSFWVFLTFPV